MAEKPAGKSNGAGPVVAQDEQRKKRLGMVVNLDRCIGCWACAVACKLENNQPMGLWWKRVLTIGGDHIDTSAGEYPNLEKYYLPMGCFHERG